jgi:hypothetical protein
MISPVDCSKEKWHLSIAQLILHTWFAQKQRILHTKVVE